MFSPPPESLRVRAATIDELLSPEFETIPGDPVRSSERVAAWCSSSAAGDGALFERRLQRDGLSSEMVRARLAGARPVSERCSWVEDAAWIIASITGRAESGPHTAPFAPVWWGIVAAADALLQASVGTAVGALLTPQARHQLRALLVDELCALGAAPLYDRFVAAGKHFDAFIAQLLEGGLRELFDQLPVLLRLVAILVRQWLDRSAEFLRRLHRDAPAIANELGVAGEVAGIAGGLSDRHRGGRSVLRVEFVDGTRVMYKPKDVHVDAACHRLIERLNPAAPITLRAARVVARPGYGWSEFVEHAGCTDPAECGTYFQRAGAWLAVLYVLAAGDMHQENVIANGAHPVPIDLETVLQEHDRTTVGDSAAYLGARALISESVLSVGLLPAYARTSSDDIYVVGGVAAGFTSGAQVVWREPNGDAMHPVREAFTAAATPNLPHVGGRYARLADHFEDLMSGFHAYATFLAGRVELLDEFAGLEVRKVMRPTQFYELLLTRLKDDRKMADGALWSAQADFVARLADWGDPNDPRWPLLKDERAALLQLDVPFFTTDTAAGRARATARISGLNADQIDWQCDLIAAVGAFEDVDLSAGPPATRLLAEPVAAPQVAAAAEEAVAVISVQAVRAADGVAWIGLEWIADSDLAQLGVVGDDLYNGNCGIGLALAAHAKVSGRPESAALAVASLAQLRERLGGPNAAHAARLLGVGGATGLGSAVYALSTMSAMLGDSTLLDDAHRVAALITDELIAADKRLDVLGGSAGAVLGLLRLHSDGGDQLVLDRAARCGDHLLAQNTTKIRGMSHGSAGFALALTALANATGRTDFADAARQHLSAIDGREPDEPWRSQWCHGAVGIGLARVGMMRSGLAGLEPGIEDALAAAAGVWPGHVDTLCCGSLGSIELFREAGRVLGRDELQAQASRRLSAVLAAKTAAGDYRWNRGGTRFNLGLFRGLAGIAYSCLRELDDSLPNVLIWE